MLDLSKLMQTKEQRGQKEHIQNTQRVAKEMFLELIEKQLTFSESMGVIQMMQQTLAEWGRNWLDNKYCSHIKNDLEEQKKI